MVDNRDTLIFSITHSIAYQAFNRPYLDLHWTVGFPYSYSYAHPYSHPYSHLLSSPKHPSTEHLNNKTYFEAYNKILSQIEYITWTQIYVGVMNQIGAIHNISYQINNIHN